MFFEDSRPDRKKRANKIAGVNRARQLESSPIPPAKQFLYFTPEEINFGGNRELAFDAESYPNYFCVSFMCSITLKVICFEDHPFYGYRINEQQVTQAQWTAQLTFVFNRFLVFGFYSWDYDLTVCSLAQQGVRAAMLYQVTDELINQEVPPWEVRRKYGNGSEQQVNHVDLIEVAPLQAPLKLYAGRLHCKRMQDLPFHHTTELQEWQVNVVRDYNINDLENTLLMWEHLKPQIDLRVNLGREYGVDLRSKSDAQIAETVIVSELRKLGVNTNKIDLPDDYSFNYKIPDFIQFKTPQFQQLLELVRQIPFQISASGNPKFPQWLQDIPRGPNVQVLAKEKDGKRSFEIKVGLGNNAYTVGLGGLHSCEKKTAHVADEKTLLIDRDVASFYPYIILNQGLYPQHLGEAFLRVFRAIVDRRIEAKRKAKECKIAGDKTSEASWQIIADSLKITINGTFGKLGNRYSRIYSPDLLIQVTMSGQLCLLMLIEMIELAGIPVVSANTDGIVIKCPEDRYKDLEAVVMIWEERTGLITEEVRYKGLYSRDVNNYIAIKSEGGCKTKGEYSEVGSALNSPLSKNPESYICSMAVQAMLEHGTPLSDTIYNCKDLTKFINVRTVKGGAEKDGIFLGKSIRWYYAQEERGTINYVQSGNKVPKSEGAKPCMNIPDAFPNNIDFDRYINDATAMLYDLGFYKKPTTGSLFQ